MWIDTAWAADGASFGLDPLSFLLIFTLAFYVLMIRPQNKQAKAHQDLLAGLQSGDEVLTSSGLMGRIAKVADDYVLLLVASGVKLRLRKQAVSQMLPKGTLKFDKA